jgi:4-amino-4-deoxy-L-arabinose transferase-like glycosyltransferase
LCILTFVSFVFNGGIIERIAPNDSGLIIITQDMNRVTAALEEGRRGKAPALAHWGALLILALAIALPRLQALNRLVTPDEPLWLNRSANFFMALSQGDLAGTYQKEHPGVTVMWAGTAAFLARYPEYLSSGLDQPNPDEFHRYFDSIKPVTPLDLLVAGRTVLILAHTLILLLAYLYACRLLGFYPAFTGFLLIAFDPFHLALTRLLHVDGLLANLLLLSMLALLCYVQERRLLDLVVSAAAAGLGLLTKLPAVLMPLVAGLLIAYAVWKKTGLHRERSLTGMVRPFLRVFLAWILILALVFVALWPAMWAAPLQTITSVVKLGKAQVEVEQGRQLFFDGEIVPTGGLGARHWYFYPLTYLWRSTPVVVIGLLLAAVAYVRKHPFTTSPPSRTVVWSMLLFIGLFTLMMSLSAKKYDRYLLPVYVPLDLLAGLGWASLAMSLSSKPFSAILRSIPLAVVLAAVVFQAALALNARPYYLTYYNPLVGGSRLAPRVMQIGWGEGLDQAAQYLNKKPGAGKLKAISSLTTGCFSYFFDGQDREMPYLSDPLEDEEGWQKFIESDYAVIYISQWQREISPPILEYVARLKPEHIVWINGLEYARIYKLH